jgi:hypothetical protein
VGGRAERLKLRLFLEGVEVPIIGAHVIGLPNAPLLASIQIPPSPEGTRLLPRTLVHLFFNDFIEASSPYVAFNKSVDDQSLKDPTAYEQQRRKRSSESGEGQDADQASFDHDTKNEQYKLLFVGEILGFQWTKNASNRSLVLQCQDLSNYWDYAYQWSNTGLFGPGIKALFSGGSTNLFTDFLTTQSEELMKLLQRPSLLFPNLKGLAGGIIHMLEGIGGSYQTSTKIGGTNIFFTLAELRLKIMQQVCCYEDDPTAERLLQRQGYGGLFNRLLGGQGRQTSIRQSINALQSIIFHETYGQPCPAYEPGTAGTVSGKVEANMADDNRTAGVAAVLTGIRTSISDVQRQLHLADQDPAAAKLAQASKSFLKSVRQSIVDRLGVMAKTLKQQLTFLRKADMQSGNALITTAAQNLNGARFLATSWQPSDTKKLDQIDKLLNDADQKIARVLSIKVSQTSKKDVRPARLNQQIFRPDVWFSSPPRCNVIFPDQYDTLTYTRSFMEEPTRLLLKTNDEFFGEDELFDHYYFAPKTRSVKGDKVKLQQLLQNDLLQHEILTGILPVFEKMGELNIFAARGGVVKDKATNVGLAQRSANFIYFKYRFAARQMQVRGRFNPYIAMGFPGLVVDKYTDVQTLELYNKLLAQAGRPTRDINKLLGTNFLGNFTQVTHTVNQNQGSTELVVSYPRQPEESVEFMGTSDKEEVEVAQRFNPPATVITDVAALSAPRVLSKGPKGGSVRAVEEVTDLYNSNPVPDTELGDVTNVSSKPLVLFGVQQKPGTTQQPVSASVPIGFSVDANLLSQQVRGALGISIPAGSSFNTIKDGQKVRVSKTPFPVTILAWRVTEDVPRFQQDTVELPAEEYIRPGWYGEIWHPAQIGKAYQTFFKTGSITDPTTIQGPGSDGSSQQGSQNVNQGPGDPGDPTLGTPAQFQLQDGASIEQAVAFLVATYSYIKQQGLDTEEFIRAYVYRPIASMVDMFGTSDLQLTQDGSSVVQGVEGLHSKAFGDFNDLFGLVTPEIEQVVGLKRDTLAAQRGDTRKLKRDQVLDLISAISFRAIIG